MDFSSIIDKVNFICETKSIDKRVYTKSGAGKDFISNIKKGSVPSIEKIFALAEYLDCSIDYLLGRTDNLNSHKEHLKNTVNSNYNSVDNSSVMVTTIPLNEHQKALLDIYNKLNPVQQAQLLVDADKMVKK